MASNRRNKLQDKPLLRLGCHVPQNEAPQWRRNVSLLQWDAVALTSTTLATKRASSFRLSSPEPQEQRMHRLLIAAAAAAVFAASVAPALADDYPPCRTRDQDHCQQVAMRPMGHFHHKVWHHPKHK